MWENLEFLETLTVEQVLILVCVEVSVGVYKLDNIEISANVLILVCVEVSVGARSLKVATPTKIES